LELEVGQCHTEIVRLLLEKGADPNLRSELYLSALENTTNKQMMELLIASGADPNLRVSHFYSALELLCACSPKNDSSRVQLLLDAGADPNVRSQQTLNALELACRRGKTDFVDLLLKTGAVVKGECYLMALHLAAWIGSTGIVRLLIGSVAEADRHNEAHDNALAIAALRGHKAVVRFLLDNGASSGALKVAPDYYPLTYLPGFKSWRAWTQEVNLEAITTNVPVDGDGSDGCGNQSEVASTSRVQLLLDTAFLDLRNQRHINALERRGKTNLVDLLLKSGTVIKGESYLIALHLAAWKGSTDAVRLLMRSVAEADRHSEAHDNALAIATLQGHEDVVRLLLDNGASSGALTVAPDRGNSPAWRTWILEKE
jgi:ankyrin repeat protein